MKASKCNTCPKLPESGLFDDRLKFNVCIDSVADAGLERVKAPHGVQLPHPLAVCAYFKCQSCGSVWQLASPEREFKGAWFRITAGT
jgi:hypothetical protein